MNRFPLWKYAMIALAVLAALLYTLPNFYGESPAVQVSSARSTIKVDAALMSRVEALLQKASLPYSGATLDAVGLKIRFEDTDTQLKAKDLIFATLNPGARPEATPEEDPRVDYVVALNLLPASPRWLAALHALPMYLGLDLRGGVHFLLQVDMQAATTKRIENLAGDVRSQLREKDIRHGGVTREGQSLKIRFRDAATREKAKNLLLSNLPDLALEERDDGRQLLLVAALKPGAVKRNQDLALKQNISTLSNRINELGVAEPIIQQQGEDRIVVQLPGVQDVARAKHLIGRTASLEIRMVDEEKMNPQTLTAAAHGQVPFGDEYYVERNGQPILVKKQVVLTGDRLVDAQPGFDAQTNEPAVHLRLDSAGSRIFQQLTRENVGKRMAILLIEKGKGEVITAPVIRSEIPGGRVQISGRMSTSEAADVALLLRAGSLAAPMEIIEERTVGPSLGKDNIAKGFNATRWGF
ncbi:MAG TPA: protein translocase subunit SecD, partial [Burkholderiales bacterium]|nr:protein translocase subunit SecD [Burkholderiales bacterium]